MHYVYLMKNSSKDVKIGFSSNIKSRLKSIQTSNSSKIKLIHKELMVDRAQAFYIEQQMHKKLKRHWIRGEWFKVDIEKAKTLLLKLKKENDLQRVGKTGVIAKFCTASSKEVMLEFVDRALVKGATHFVFTVEDFKNKVYNYDKLYAIKMQYKKVNKIRKLDYKKDKEIIGVLEGFDYEIYEESVIQKENNFIIVDIKNFSDHFEVTYER